MTTEKYCPAWGPGVAPCSPSVCDCFIAEFPDDMKQAGSLHPEFFTVAGTVNLEPRGDIRA